MRAKNGHNNVKVRNKVWRSLGGRTQSSPKESGKKLDIRTALTLNAQTGML